MPALYAEALYASYITKPTLERFRVLAKRMKEVLKERGHQRLEAQVYAQFLRRIEVHLRHGAMLTVARETDVKKHHSAVQEMLKEYAVDSKQLQTAIDPDMIGGYMLKLGSKQVDASYRSQLVRLFETLQK